MENLKVIFHLEREVSFCLMLTQARQQISETNKLEALLPKLHSDRKEDGRGHLSRLARARREAWGTALRAPNVPKTFCLLFLINVEGMHM